MNQASPVLLYDLLILSTGYELVAQKSTCKDANGKRQQTQNLGKMLFEGCRSACKRLSSILFKVARADSKYCEGELCFCSCYPEVYTDGHCKLMQWRTDDVWRIIEE